MMKESQIKPKLKIYNINWSACWLNNCPTVVGQNMYLLLDTSIRIIENQHILNINLYNYHICSLYYLIMSAANYGVSYGAILVISVHCIDTWAHFLIKNCGCFKHRILGLLKLGFLIFLIQGVIIIILSGKHYGILSYKKKR